MQMPLISSCSDLLLTIYRLAQDTPVLEFQDELLGALKSCIPFDSSMWGTATMTSNGVDVHSIHLHQSSQAMLVAYEAVKHLDSPAQRLAEQSATTLSFNSDLEFAGPGKEGMRALCEEFGHRNGLITCEINPFTKFDNPSGLLGILSGCLSAGVFIARRGSEGGGLFGLARYPGPLPCLFPFLGGAFLASGGSS